MSIDTMYAAAFIQGVPYIQLHHAIRVRMDI